MPKKQKTGGKRDTAPRNRKSLNASFVSSSPACNPSRNGRNAFGNSPAQHFSLRDEVMNTERHHQQWTPAKRLRDQRISFVSAGTIAPLEEAELDDPKVDLQESTGEDALDPEQESDPDHGTKPDGHDDLEDLDASDGAMAQMKIDVDTTVAELEPSIVDGRDNIREQEQIQDKPTVQETFTVEESIMTDAPPVEEPVVQEEDPMASMFFVDTQGDNTLAFKGARTVPAARSTSPTPSDSSEEVVFRGRGVVVRDDPPKPNQAPSASRPQAPQAPQAPSAPAPHPVPSAPLAPTRGPLDVLMAALEAQDPPAPSVRTAQWGQPVPVKEEPKAWAHADGSVSHKQNVWPTQPQPRLDDQLSAIKPSSRKSKKSRKKQNKLFRSELDPEDVEDELLQDYINNMDPEELAAFGFGTAESDDSTDDLFDKLLDHDEVDAKLNPTEIAGIDTSSGSDSWGTDNGEEDDEDDEDEEEGDDLDDLDSSDLESELEYNEREQWEDEADLRQRQIDAMTDEEVARIYAKQAELGIDGDDLLLFDDSGFGDVSAAREGIDRISSAGAFTTTRSRNKNGMRKASKNGGSGKKSDFFPDASLMADVLEQDPYGGFDVMDFSRPSLRTKTKGRKSAGPLPEELGLSDDELVADLQSSWANDRSKKAAKKAEREELRQLGLLGGNKKGNKFKPDLSVRYAEGISMAQVRGELSEFLDNDEWTTKAFPPMLKADRKVLHEIAAKFNLKSKSVGSGKNRAPVLIKTSRTLSFSDETFARAQNMVQRSFFRQSGKKGKSDKFASDKNKKRGGAGGAAGYSEGQVVGASAPEIGASNFGRKLMEKMGWQAGMALGKEGNVGLLVPVEARIKSGKAGLG